MVSIAIGKQGHDGWNANLQPYVYFGTTCIARYIPVNVLMEY